MCGIARKSAPIHVIVYYPKTEAGQRELANRVAGIHADIVNHRLQDLNCSSEQKIQLLDAIIKTVKEKAGELIGVVHLPFSFILPLKHLSQLFRLMSFVLFSQERTQVSDVPIFLAKRVGVRIAFSIHLLA